MSKVVDNQGESMGAEKRYNWHCIHYAMVNRAVRQVGQEM